MRILVFGSNGLVGANLKGVLNQTSHQNFFSVRKDTNLFNYEETSNLIKDFNPDVIVNCAARVGGIVANDKNRTEFLLENLKININVLESLVELNPIKFINLGSSCIYPLNADNPISEESIMSGKLEPTNSAYAMAKLTAIELGNSIRKEFGHEIINLMPTNLYGKFDNFSEIDSHVIPGLIRRMHKAKTSNHETFNVWGTGKPLREFLYAEDLAKAILFILDNKINDELINVGSNTEISIKDLALKVKSVVGFNGEVEFDKDLPDGNPRKLLDSSKIFDYGWSPLVGLDEGLNITYNWYLNNLNYR